jgi:hypothetical protein
VDRSGAYNIGDGAEMPPRLILLWALGLMLVVEVLGPEATTSADGVGQGWTPRRCVADTLSVLEATSNRITVDTVAPGITYRCILDRRGPWVVHLVAVDLSGGRYAFDAVRGTGAFFGRERVSAMAKRSSMAGLAPIVGINADFFDLRTGEVENNHVEGGEWVKGVMDSDSPHDAFDNAHAQFAIDERGRPLIDRFELHGLAIGASRTQPLVGINYRPARRDGLVLYTPWYGAATPSDTSDRIAPVARDSTGAARSITDLRADSARRLSTAATRQAIEITLRRLGRRGDTVLYRVLDPSASTGGGKTIPREGAVLSGTGHARAMVEELARKRGVVRVVARLGGWRTPARAVAGGWGRLVKDGLNVGIASDSLEGTFPRFSSARHPRSAIGISRDSSTVMLMVVDGRRPWSVGMSLGELADALIALGAWDAMNFDGGGSSTLWVNGTVVNYPSDAVGERAVGNAMFVLRRK